MCELYLQCVLNLMGKSTAPSVTVLKGEATKDYKMEQVMRGCVPDEFPVNVAWFAQLMLSYYFEDYERAAEMAVEHENFGGLDWPLVWSVPHPYFRGLAYAAKCKVLFASPANCCGWLAKRREISFFLDRAKKQLELLKLYADNKMLNAIHMYLILKADLMSITAGSNVDEVTKAYSEGIKSAARSGFRQDSALASERLGEYLMQYDSETAEMYIQNALQDYGQWGAEAKVEALKRKHPTIKLDDTACNVSSIASGRSGRKLSGPPKSLKASTVQLTAELCD